MLSLRPLCTLNAIQMLIRAEGKAVPGNCSSRQNGFVKFIGGQDAGLAPRLDNCGGPLLIHEIDLAVGSYRRSPDRPWYRPLLPQRLAGLPVRAQEHTHF